MKAGLMEKKLLSVADVADGMSDGQCLRQHKIGQKSIGNETCRGTDEETE